MMRIRSVCGFLWLFVTAWVAGPAHAQTTPATPWVEGMRYFGQSPTMVVEGEVRGGYLVLSRISGAFNGVTIPVSCGSGMSLSNRLKLLPSGEFEGTCSIGGAGVPATVRGPFPDLQLFDNFRRSFSVTFGLSSDKEAFLRDHAAGKVASTREWLQQNQAALRPGSPSPAATAPSAASSMGRDAENAAQSRVLQEREQQLRQREQEARQREIEARQREQLAQQRELEARQREEEARRREAELQRQLAEARAATAAAIAASSSPAPAQSRSTRHALVVGIDRYQSISPLRNASADARSIAQSLQQFGYTVRQHLDVNERGFKQAVRDFRAQINPGGWSSSTPATASSSPGSTTCYPPMSATRARLRCVMSRSSCSECSMIWPKRAQALRSSSSTPVVTIRSKARSEAQVRADSHRPLLPMAR
jgi:hypothetical protein